MKKSRSFLKWAGSKYSCLDHILAALPPASRLVEPFLGSGVVFLNSNYTNYLLGETNQDLVNLYHHLQKEGDTFITYCQKYFLPETNQKEVYYQFRDLFNQTKVSRKRAALFMYLNRHGYNGLCRFNQSGVYNVPFGSYQSPRFPIDEMRLFHQKSSQATFINADFRETFSKAKGGDVIYCDPPYSPIEQTTNFSSYTRHGFSEKAHLELAELAREKAKEGVTVIISNHDTKFTRKLYQGSHAKSFMVHRFISSDTMGRTPVSEILAVFKS